MSRDPLRSEELGVYRADRHLLNYDVGRANWIVLAAVRAI